MAIYTRNTSVSKSAINDLIYKRIAVLKKIACFIITLSLTTAIFSQASPWPSDCSNIVAGGNDCPPPNCPPANRDSARLYRGVKLVAPAGCNISTTPGEPIAAPTITCPVKSISYSTIEPPTSQAFLQYCSFENPEKAAGITTDNYGATSQGWITQLFCSTDAFGLPAPPTGITFVEKLSRQEASLPSRENSIIVDQVNAQLIQLDFWLLLPPTIPTVGIQIGERSADATALFVGPNLNSMCPVAEFIETGQTDGVWVGYGNRTGYYTVPTTGVSQTCNANILRVRLYISDISAGWNSNPLLDIGNGFENLTNLPVIAATSGDDNTLPVPTLRSEGTGYIDANGNVFDINGNWIPVACKTPGTDETDIAASTVDLDGTTTICFGDTPAPSYTINGAPGSMVTYNIDGGANMTVTLDGSGMATITASNTVSSTLNLVSVDFDNGNSCDLSSTASITVKAIPAPTVSGTATICSGDAVDDYVFTGPPNAVITYTLDGVTAMITLDATGMATLPASNTTSSTVSLVSVDDGGCIRNVSGDASVTVIQPATASVTGGTFCAGATAGFSFSGTPNTIVTYNIDGGANMTITLDASGMATLAATSTATLNLISVAYGGTPDCSQPLSGSAEVIVLAEILVPTVTGGNFCGAATANFTITGTPNTVVTYNVDGGANTSITVDATGMFTVATTENSVLNLVSVAYPSAPNCSQPLTGSAIIIINGPTCFTPTFTWSFIDPCNCNNPANVTLADGTLLIADFIRVDASQYTNPIVTLSLADANFLDNMGAPVVAANATFVARGGGIFELPYYTRVDAPASFAVDVSGDVQAGRSSACAPCGLDIPTMSQWGLLIYGLLILNLFIGVLYRKKLVSIR